MTLLFALFYVLPVAISAALYLARGGHTDWRAADRATTGLLRTARENPDAVVRVFSARTVSWLHIPVHRVHGFQRIVNADSGVT
jgi:hypothetical protein